MKSWVQRKPKLVFGDRVEGFQSTMLIAVTLIFSDSVKGKRDYILPDPPPPRVGGVGCMRPGLMLYGRDVTIHVIAFTMG